MKNINPILTILLLFITSIGISQNTNSIQSTVNRIYKFNAGTETNPYYRGALEIEYKVPFRLRQNIDFPEISEVYNLGSSWKIPQCQQNIRIDTFHGENLIFTFELWTQNDTVTLEYLKQNEVIESKEYILQFDSFPKSSNLDLIEGLIKHPIKANHKFKEYQKINYFSIYKYDALKNKSKVTTGLVATDGDDFAVDTIDIQTLSALSITPTIWCARGYSKPQEFGVTALYYGVTDSIEYEESWKTHKLKDLTLRNIFIKESIIHLLTSRGIFIFENDTIIPDPSFDHHLEQKHGNTFHGLFDYQGEPAVIFNENIFVKKNNKWTAIYTFLDTYQYESTAVSINSDSIYFVADRKLWMTNLDTTIRIRPDIKDIMRISKGPQHSILYKQGKGDNNCDHGGIYFSDNNTYKPLKREYLSEYPDLTINDIIYMENSNKIIVTSYPGVFEFELEEWLEKDDNN